MPLRRDYFPTSNCTATVLPQLTFRQEKIRTSVMQEYAANEYVGRGLCVAQGGPKNGEHFLIEMAKRG